MDNKRYPKWIPDRLREVMAAPSAAPSPGVPTFGLQPGDDVYAFWFRELLDAENDREFPARHQAVLAALRREGIEPNPRTLLAASVNFHASDRGLISKDDFKAMKRQLSQRIKKGDEFLKYLDPLPGRFRSWGDHFSDDYSTSNLAKKVHSYLAWLRDAQEELNQLALTPGAKSGAALDSFLLELMRLWQAHTGKEPITWINDTSNMAGGDILPLAVKCVVSLAKNHHTEKSLTKIIDRLRPHLR